MVVNTCQTFSMFTNVPLFSGLILRQVTGIEKKSWTLYTRMLKCSRALIVTSTEEFVRIRVIVIKKTNLLLIKQIPTGQC